MLVVEPLEGEERNEEKKNFLPFTGGFSFPL